MHFINSNNLIKIFIYACQSILTSGYIYTSWAISSSILSGCSSALSIIKNSIWCVNNLIALNPYRLIVQKYGEFFGKRWILKNCAKKHIDQKSFSLLSCKKRKKKKGLRCSRATAASYKNRESSLGLQNVFFIIILPLLLPSFLPKLSTV